MTVRGPASGSRLALPRYRSVAACTRRSTRRTTARQHCVRLPGRSFRCRRDSTEVTGPLLGAERMAAGDADLTKGHSGEPLGERIILAGRVLDWDGGPCPPRSSRSAGQCLGPVRAQRR